MNKDFDLNLKMEKGSSDDVTPRIASIAYCTPGCITGELCGSSEGVDNFLWFLCPNRLKRHAYLLLIHMPS